MFNSKMNNSWQLRPSGWQKLCKSTKYGLIYCTFFGPKSIFSEMIYTFCYYHDWTPNRQHFYVDPVARRVTWVLKTRLIQKKIAIIFLKPNFRKLQNNSTNVSLKIGSKVPQKLGPFFSLFLMRKPLSSGQKWFLRPYFPLIRSMFLLRSGLRFLFRALDLFLTLGWSTSSAQNKNLRPLLNRNIPLISGKYGLRNHF